MSELKQVRKMSSATRMALKENGQNGHKNAQFLEKLPKDILVFLRMPIYLSMHN